jgi:hypothetical protein
VPPNSQPPTPGQKPLSVMVERSLTLSVSSMAARSSSPLPSSALAHNPCSSGDNLTCSPTECGDIYWCGWAPRKAPLVLFLSSIGWVLCLWLPHGANDPSPTHVPIPDRSIPFPHRHARRVSNFIQTACGPYRHEAAYVGEARPRGMLPSHRGNGWRGRS